MRLCPRRRNTNWPFDTGGLRLQSDTVALVYQTFNHLTNSPVYEDILSESKRLVTSINVTFPITYFSKVKTLIFKLKLNRLKLAIDKNNSDHIINQLLIVTCLVDRKY